MYVGIDIGGTKILAASSPTGHSMKRSQKIATPENPRATVDAIVDLVHQVSGGRAIASLGVSCPGPIDADRGVVVEAGNLGWKNVPLKRLLEKRLHVNVTLENDAACGGIAEARLGAGINFQHVLYITISTGIGTSLLVDGQLYRGSRNLEGGHITVQKDGPKCSCGKLGHFEAIASGKAIKRDFGKYAYEIKDKPTWDKIAANMAVGIASLSATLAPDVVILAGGVSVHWVRFHKSLERHIGDYLPYQAPTLRLAKYIETAPVIGALLLASQAEQLLL